MTEEVLTDIPATSEDRPQTAVRDRKVPGGFDADARNDLSPNKEDFQDSIPVNTKSHEDNNRQLSLDPNILPSLPPGDSSLLYNPSDNILGSDTHQDSVDEKEMQRHLNDVESSFMPIASPIGMDAKKGADDSYLFDGAQPPPRYKERPPQDSAASTEPIQTSDSTTGDHGNDIYSPPSPAYQTLAPNPDLSQLDETEMDAGNNTSSLETMSSPTAAAAARTVSRAISMAHGGSYDEPLEAGNEPSQLDHLDDIEATPRKPKSEPFVDLSSDSTLHRNLSNQSLNNFIGDAGNTPGLALNRKSSGRKPKYLRSRYSSQHSSISSLLTNLESHDGSDVTLGAEADYALQSGGAIPAGGFSRSSSTAALSRSISLGSMASEIEDFSAGPNPDPARLEGSLATLTEEELNRERKGPDDTSPPETPRATSTNRTMAVPTDTIIARRVRNVQVPESVAREYRSKNGVSPKRSAFSRSTLSKSGKNMTLKEQSSTIERLSKENFDLKLKVMFLSERLDKLSEEGVKEMISENVELKTGLAIIQRDNKALRKKVKELEKKLKDDEERPSTARSETSTGNPSPKWFYQEGAQEREEELLYLRERVEEYVTEIEKLRSDALARENEKRNLAEVVRQMGERRGQNVEAREEMDVWKDLLESETARREQVDEDNKKLRDEIFRLKTEGSSVGGIPGLNHTTNIYNITKKRQVSPSRPRSRLSDQIDERNGTLSAASTLVEELRRQSEQLRHENAELRREVGAQTSMLTSRNREKERLYQEIEDLKLGARRAGGSVAGDSIFERSASRAHERSHSRASASTRQNSLADAEREEFENKHAELRDRINSLKIHNQDLQRELQSCMEDFETAVQQKKEAESLAAEMQEALEVAENDLITMQTDRDEALQGQEEIEAMFNSLRQEAQEEVNALNADRDEANAEIERLQRDLGDTTENFNALQNEMREMSEGLVRLEDDHERKTKRIQELEQEIDDANRELEQMEQNLVDANGKINRLTVQQESSQGEIAFLREEQDGDKIKIGDLEAALRNSEQGLQDERECIKELEQRLDNERHQREIIATQEKQEVQQFINELNREASNAKDEARRLRKKLSSTEVESAEWRQRLMDLENGLKEALGNVDGTRSTFSTAIIKLQHELENTIRDLDATKASLAEKERWIKNKTGVLESAGLETRKLADLLDKERREHSNTRNQLATFQKNHQHTLRTLSQHESRVLELETSHQQDKKKIANFEVTFKTAMDERNTLLLNVWGRLSALCGTDWAHNNSIVNGRALPSLEVVANMLPGFSKNLMSAIKTIETLVGEFRVRIKSVEKDLWKEYRTLETNLEVRTKRLEHLEAIARNIIPGVTGDGRGEIARLREANKTLKTEISALRAANDVRAGVYSDPAPSPSVLTGPRNKVMDKSRTSTLTRHQSASAVETFDRVIKSRAGSVSGRGDNITGSLSPHSRDEDFRPDMRWQVRLQELEYKLKAEREARRLDRTSALQRLEEKDRENAELAAQVHRERSRVRDGR